jgi:MFS family permease
MTTVTKRRRFRPHSLDAVNFLLANVRGTFGPYLNVFMVTQQHWSQAKVGLVTTIGRLLGLSVRTPIGAAIEETRSKRGAIVLALAVLALGGIVIFAMSTFWAVAIVNSVMAVVGDVGDVFCPSVAALALGLYTRKQLARVVETQLSAMRATSPSPSPPVLSGMSSRSARYFYSSLSSPCLWVWRYFRFRLLRSTTTGRDMGGDATADADAAPARAVGWSILFKSRPLVIFRLCVMLFQFANAALLPLVGQQLAAAYPKEATAMMSACIVAAQLVTLPIALLVGRTADTWGRKPLFLTGWVFLIWGGGFDLDGPRWHPGAGPRLSPMG